jgi:S-adenosylhomocysteine hydrolase
MVNGTVQAAVRSWDHRGISQIPESLPLLDRMRETLPPPAFKGIDLLCIQHHLVTIVPLVKAFVTDGVEVQRIWHIDIPYSTIASVHEVLRTSLGHPSRMSSLLTDPLADYTTTQLLRVVALLIELAERRESERLLVLDDGAYFVRAITALQSVGHPAGRAFNGSHVVEQTTRGHRFLSANQRQLRDLDIRAVSVARCHTKMNFEGPFIGASVAAAVAEYALRLAEVPARVAVLGFGVVGEATASELRNNFPDAQLIIVDSRAEARARASVAIPSATIVESVADASGYDLVVGCTGRNSFTIADRSTLASQALLASGSSAALEFDRAGFVELADAFADDDIEILDRESTRARGIHAAIRIRFEGGREATIVNGGFPVNFDGERETLGIEMIQPTRCLMYAAAQQAVAQVVPGVEPLATWTDMWIFREALNWL